MSFFGSIGGPKGIPAKAPQIRKVQRTVTKPVPPTPITKALPPARLPARPSPATTASSTPPHTNSSRSSPATSSSTRKRKADSQDPDRARAIRGGTKRKLATPPATPLFGSSSESEEDADDDTAARDSLSPNKKAKTTNGLMDKDSRRLRDVAHWNGKEKLGGKKYKLVHSADLASANDGKDYIPLFERPIEDPVSVELYYPGSSQPERFILADPKDKTNHNPAADLIETITAILTYFFPKSISDSYLNESTGLPYLLRRALRTYDLPSFQSTLSTFNDLITTSRVNHTLANHIDSGALSHTPLPLDLTDRILTQCFSRTVSPHVERLRDYASFSDSVYGEILSPFASEIFRSTGLTHSSVFLDLGSGVGNVVLQAALELGCEAHGIEFEANPAGLATQQAEEFRARCRRYGLAAGRVNLIQGNFLTDTRILRDVLPRADVILVNNYAFSSTTNDSLRHVFLDVKDGAKIVSLKSFVPAKWRLEERTSGDIAAVLKVERREFWRGSVSWTDREGEWFLQEKDSSALKAFLGGGSEEGGRRRAR